jgi:HD superfamily phosphohydrolase
MDRLDYLKRDSFYSGVSEGVVSNQRIIKMLNIVNDELVIEEKGIYSIEKFIVARRLMYWQVYLHKTVISAEFLLVRILERAKYLASQDEVLFATPAFDLFLFNEIGEEEFKNPEVMEAFAQLDDFDIMTSVKVWCNHSDVVLSTLSEMLVNRNLLKVKLQKEPFSEEAIKDLKKKVSADFGITLEEANYFVFTNWIENNAYNPASDKINIRYKDGSVKDITDASDNLNIQALAQPVRKYYLCYPKED